MNRTVKKTTDLAIQNRNVNANIETRKEKSV